MSRLVFRTAPGQERELVQNWVKIPALRALVEDAGGTWPAVPLEDLLEHLERFSSIWDKRSGDSRLIFKTLDEARDDAAATSVYDAARALGLLNSAPPTMTEASHVLILGGLATGVEPRARYAAELIGAGAVTTSSVVALGSFRRVDERERPAAAHYAPNAVFEIDLLSAILAESFGHHELLLQERLDDPFSDPTHAEEIRRFDGTPAISIYAARSSAPDVRPANTADTYRQFANDVDLHPGDQLLIITSSIYRPYQHLDAVRILSSYGVDLETIGVPSERLSTAHPPSAYLQEVRSALRAARDLLAIDASGH